MTGLRGGLIQMSLKGDTVDVARAKSASACWRRICR